MIGATNMRRVPAYQSFGKHRVFVGLVLLILSLVPVAAFAVTPEEMLHDPKLEARARNLSAQLRCMVCQNESIDESEASLARDIRLIVREKIAAGESDEAIRAFLVKRYGDFILLKPPFKIETALLWGAPVLLLIVGGLAIFFAVARRGQPKPAAALTEAEAAKLASLLGKENG
jgi:cytochrome c-type biogenesis protein CcmH